MQIFRIMYYCYFSLFNNIVFTGINRDFVVRLLSVTLMSLFITAFLKISVNYLTDFNINHKLLYVFSLLIITGLYMLLVYKNKHSYNISRIDKTKYGIKFIYYLVVYSLTILVFVFYYKFIP
jgi:hypothetical protein